MKTLLKRMSAVLLVLFIVVSLIPSSTIAAPASSKVYTTPTGYDEASDVRYSTSNVSGKQVVANWGARGEDCVFLTSYAANYYTGDYTYAKLSALTGGSSQSNASSSRLYQELQELLTSKHTFYTYYDGNKNVRNFYKYTDCVSNDTSKVALLYRGILVSSTWDGGNTWNQEHVWPQSKLSGSQQIGDIMHLRPSNPSENSSRGNTAYGEGSGYYNPGPSVRGDCARIVLYMYVRWGKTNTWGSSGVMQSADVLLKWMAEDPVDTWEMGRNDAVQSVTGVRNVFVDYPELAWQLFGQSVPSNVTTPSGNKGTSANPGGTTTPPVTNPPVTNPPVTNPPVTNPPVTNPVGTTPVATTPATTPVGTTPVATTPATQPSGNTTTPPVSQPSGDTNNDPQPTANPEPIPLATNAVVPPTLPKATEPSNRGNIIEGLDDILATILIIVGGIIVVGGAATALIVYFAVIRPKKMAAAAEVPAEETPDETPAEETPNETPTEENE